MSRDTLFLLDRTIIETEDDLETEIRLHGIDTAECDRLSTGQGGPASHQGPQDRLYGPFSFPAFTANIDDFSRTGFAL